MFVRVSTWGLLIVWIIGNTAWAATTRPLDDWFDPSLPLFASDLIYDARRNQIYVADQISAQVFAFSPGDSTAKPLGLTGFSPARSEALELLGNGPFREKLLGGELRLELEPDGLFLYDGRKVFGSDRWIQMDVSRGPGSAQPVRPARLDMTPGPRDQDQSLLAEAVADLAGRGRRVKPWRWSARNHTFQLIDAEGRAYVFSVESRGSGQNRLRWIAELDSLFARLTNLLQAELRPEKSGALHIRTGRNRWTATVADDPFTGERVLNVEPDTAGSPARPYKPPKTPGRPNLPLGWSDYFQRLNLLVEGPAGQLIFGRMRLTHSGDKSFVMISQGGRIRLFPWDGAEPSPEEVVILPEGFLVQAPPYWLAAGWTSEFTGLLDLGNSRFQRLAPIVSGAPGGSPSAAEPDRTEATGLTAGLFVLDAENPALTEWPILEWPRLSLPEEMLMTAEPQDLTVTGAGEVYVLAKDEDRGLRLFRMGVAPEPVLDLPDDVLPEFLSGVEITLNSQDEKKRTLWTVAGHPPALVRKGRLDLGWQVGQGIYWRYEPEGVILFSTDPTGESDTALTVQIEGADVSRALRLGDANWVLETESGIFILDAADPTAPDILPVDEEGRGLRPAAQGAIFEVPGAGAVQVWEVGQDGNKKSLGRFRESWAALGADAHRIFFRDRSAHKLHVVRRSAKPTEDEIGQMTGRLNFDYDDPTPVLLVAVGGEAHAMLVRPKAPTYLLGPMPYGMYRMDVSAGFFDFPGPTVFSLIQPEMSPPDMRLVKTLDFIYRRAIHFHESGNLELARFNYELYLSLYPSGRSVHDARSALLALYADEERWDEMIEFYRKSPPETRWTFPVLLLLLDRLPRLADRLEIAKKSLTIAPQDEGAAAILFFLYKHTLDASFKSGLDRIGVPPVYRRFFESFDRSRL